YVLKYSSSDLVCFPGVVGETDGVKSVSVMEGDSVTLQSDVSEVQRDDLIVWRFGDKGILLAKIDVETNETSLNDADERFRDRLKLDEARSLTIKKTRTTDSGLYEVQIRGSESSQRFLLSVSGSGLSPGFIAGIVFAALLVAAVVASVVIHYRHKISELEKQVGEYYMSMADGDSVTLKTKTVLKEDDKVQWWYHDDNDLIAEINGETNGIFDGFDKRFRSKLVLNDKTGDLTINNTMSNHSGLYILEISSETRRINKRFIVTVKMMKVSVAKGGSVTLQTDTKIQRADEIMWTFGAENCLVIKADSGTTIGKRFTGRLKLDKKTGTLIIRKIETADSGHFKLQIINIKSVLVMEGDSVTLNPDLNQTQGFKMIQWWFGDIRSVIAEINANEISYPNDEILRDRLQLNQTGSLSIKNKRTTDSGLYKLEVHHNSRASYMTFSVTVYGEDIYYLSNLDIFRFVFVL
uniref:Ig-like domain-containing protein n=1 Tax=Sinocyclocheilus anshuiensis TaxID=1608454 RepID=A0A671LFK3_9TELE